MIISGMLPGNMRAVLVFVVAAGAVIAQSRSDILLEHTFQKDTSGWIAMGQGGTVSLANGALTLTYQLGTKQFAAAVLPIPSGLARMQRIKFRAKTDHDTAVGVLLSERKPGGGNYSAWFWAPANVTQQIEFTPADFAVSDGPNDPVDPDGKLDLDQVEGIAIVDFAYFLSALPQNANFPVRLNRSSGSHTLLLENFRVLSSAPQQKPSSPALIDDFSRGFVEWITLGDMDLKLSVASNPLGMPALQATYEESQGQYALLLRRVANLDLSGARRLKFDIASEREVTLAISLEMKKSGSTPEARYNLTIFPPAGRKVFHVNLSLDDFERDQNSPAGKLDPSLLKSVAITDISTATSGEGGRNTIWIGKIEAGAEPR